MKFSSKTKAVQLWLIFIVAWSVKRSSSTLSHTFSIDSHALPSQYVVNQCYLSLDWPEECLLTLQWPCVSSVSTPPPTLPPSDSHTRHNSNSTTHCLIIKLSIQVCFCYWMLRRWSGLGSYRETCMMLSPWSWDATCLLTYYPPRTCRRHLGCFACLF